ncbi:hypothetical protein DSO57_1026650 [Entomophthora muscae]|uniref:Uncharacterized protein n=1 Tax=Entomophthora muscae TaxID=34485 RepID=A0ACC2RGM0_9FUNG|nr:hypothetical protein DSO57_1026650 [Entomophthora muscae]
MKFFKATLISLVSATTVNDAFANVGSTGYLDFAGVQLQSVQRQDGATLRCTNGDCHLDTSIKKKAYLYLKYENGFIFNDEEIKSLLTPTGNKLDYIGAVFDFREGDLVIILKVGAKWILGKYIENLFDLLRNGDKLFIRFAQEDYDHVNSMSTWDRIKNRIAELNKGPYELSLTTENENDAIQLKGEQYGVRIVIEEIEKIDTPFSSSLNVC